MNAEAIDHDRSRATASRAAFATANQCTRSALW
jgi:hypothetical protein